MIDNLSSIYDADYIVSVIQDWTTYLIVGALAAVFTFARPIFRRIKTLLRSLSVRIIALQISSLIVSVACFLYINQILAIIIACVGMIAAPWWQLRNFRRMGLSAAFTKTSQGIGFEASLSLATRNFDFLGIGANKLIKCSNFEDAMARCGSSGRIARFLLSHPENPSLERMARRNGVDPQEYKERVRNTIDEIKKIQRKRGLNIEVRLYRGAEDQDFQRFRLLFIDEELCLLGWTVWGSHEGKENPQVVLYNKKNSAESDQTMYKAFSDYYELLWRESTAA